ncbi:MAG: glycine betaine ABC transporter substrate-binding protein [Aeromicrobium sp.]|uniref:glycine betaine ABC transporter substrate-binding protein n=1 Tax=Aeromicrobium sp. TaxID=1871063 RepID=UPI003C45B7E0
MRKSVKIAAATAALAMAVTGCGNDSGGGGGSSDRLDGVSLTVGSKDFTENILLAEMFAQALENEGASVNNKVNLGGTSVNRDALTSGDIDVYPEYNGTGWTVHLGNEDPSQDPQELYDVTAKADLEKNGIQWVGLSPFNDTYGFAANGDLAKAEGGFDFQKMADYLKANPDATVCMETEFPDRPDGLVLWEKATGYELPSSQTQILDTGLIYTETADGNCDFGEVFTTDGRITALNLQLVEDPGVMIVYNVSFTMSDELYQANATVYDELTDSILAGLDNDKMAELNALVDVEGTPAERVAEDYLKEVGVL